MSEAFGKYVLIEPIAQGGMAEIFSARMVNENGKEEIIALKRILSAYNNDADFIEMFKDEAKLASYLKHDNIVNIYDFGEVEGSWFIAMEFINGRDLKCVLDDAKKLNKRLTLAQILFVIMETAKALDYAHAMIVDGNPLKLVHRDVTPHNVMVSMSGDVKLMDFGIAKAADRATKTRAGVIKGKAAYMSPEQARGKPLDGRSDMFTLGIMFWEMVTGERLFAGGSDFDILRRVLRCNIKSPRGINPDLPIEVDNIIMKILSKNRDDRYVNCGGVVDAVSDYFYSKCEGAPNHGLEGFVKALFSVDGHDPSEIPDYTPPVTEQPKTQALPSVAGPVGGMPGMGSGAMPGMGGSGVMPGMGGSGAMPAPGGGGNNPYYNNNPFTQASTNAKMQRMEEEQPRKSSRNEVQDTNTGMIAFQPQATNTSIAAGPVSKKRQSSLIPLLIGFALLGTLLVVGGGATYLIIKKQKQETPVADEVVEDTEEVKAQKVAITFYSKPSGATIKVDGKFLWNKNNQKRKTPYKMDFELGASPKIEFIKEGYHPFAGRVRVTRKVVEEDKGEIRRTLTSIKPIDPKEKKSEYVAFSLSNLPNGTRIYLDGNMIGVKDSTKTAAAKEIQLPKNKDSLVKVVIPSKVLGEPARVHSKTFHPPRDRYLDFGTVVAANSNGGTPSTAETLRNLQKGKIYIPQATKPKRKRSGRRSKRAPKIMRKSSKESKDGKTRISVRINPWGTIKVDGKEVGKSSTRLEIAPGSHHVEVYYPHQNKVDRATVKLKARHETTLVFNFIEPERLKNTEDDE